MLLLNVNGIGNCHTIYVVFCAWTISRSVHQIFWLGISPSFFGGCLL